MGLGNSGWDVTAPFGFEGEEIVADLLSWPVDNRHVEAKRKSFADDLFFIEVECRYGGSWAPSGLSVTKASYWAFVVGGTGITVVVPTRCVRRAVEVARAKHLALTNGAPGGDHPTRGYLVPFRFFTEGTA